MFPGLAYCLDSPHVITSGACFTSEAGPVNYADARGICGGLGGHLAAPFTEQALFDVCDFLVGTVGVGVAPFFYL